MDITPEQLAFMSGAEPAKDIHVVMPLLRAGLMKPNPDAPPMFIRTAEGDAILTDHGYLPVQGLVLQCDTKRVCVEITIPASAAGDTG